MVVMLTQGDDGSRDLMMEVRGGMFTLVQRRHIHHGNAEQRLRPFDGDWLSIDTKTLPAILAHLLSESGSGTKANLVRNLIRVMETHLG